MKKCKGILFITMIFSAAQVNAWGWRNAFINKTNETVTIYPRYVRRMDFISSKEIFYDIEKNLHVLAPGQTFEKEVKAWCLMQVLFWKGDQRAYITELATKGTTDTDPGELFPEDVYSSVNKFLDIGISENRCRHWDITIMLDEYGNLEIEKYGHVFRNP